MSYASLIKGTGKVVAKDLGNCRRYGCPEITVAFCDSDDATYGNMHPSLSWGRTSTLGHGAHCCDFRLTTVKNEVKLCLSP